MPLSAGEKLGPYEILAPIGAGGMGEVYKARDTRLDRIVAIKTSKTEFSERFEREARAVAALNHSSICTLYDVGPNYLVMEYIEGTPLKGPLPVDQAMQYAVQICDALDAAHKKGITHRDLKPANILVTKTGIKLLDFGLAKLGSSGITQGASPPNDATLTMALTGKNEIVGTLYYMSPEQLQAQANGHGIDSRSDIFSFGLVLYEMLTGKRAIEGSSPASVIAAIIERPAPSIAGVAPAALDDVLKACLAKDPDERWQSARDLRTALDLVSQRTRERADSTSRRAHWSWLWPASVILLGLTTLGLASWIFWPKTEPATFAVRFQAEIPRDVAAGQYVSVSPDGRKLVFNSTGLNGGLWVRELDALEWRRLPGTENASGPFWSPDSKYLAFGVAGQLRKIDIAEGPPQTLAEIEFPVGSGAWNRNGVIIFGGRGRGPLWQISQSGGTPVALTELNTARGEVFHSLPTFLPDEKHFIYYVRTMNLDQIGMFSGSLDTRPQEQPKERFLATTYAAAYSDGYLLFIRDSALIAQPFDAKTFRLTGEPVTIAPSVAIGGSNGVFSASSSGTLAFRQGAAEKNVVQTWLDRQGKVLSTFGPPSSDRDIRLSPDGTRAVVRDSPPGTDGELWILDFGRVTRTRLTFGRQRLISPGVWSADASRMAFAAGVQRDRIFERTVSSAAEEKELLRELDRRHTLTDWSRDGRFLLYNSSNPGRDELWILSLEGDRKSVRLLGTEFSEGNGVFSPDMRWIAYNSTESGRSEVYVRPFLASGPSLGEGKWQVSRDGGTSPRWRGDGRELFFSGVPDGGVKMAVQIKSGSSTFEPGVPQRLFQTQPDVGWDVASDGKRFLLSLPQPQFAQTPLNVVLNWRAQLRR